MGISLRRLFVLAGLSASAFALTPSACDAQNLAEQFKHPPADARPMVRWWWFGPNLQPGEVVREIRAMKEGGFGGFELQTVYPLTVDSNASFLSQQHLAAIRLANNTALAEGLRVDLTLGSGWPFGGPHISTSLASSAVKLVEIPAGTGVLPPLRDGEHVLAVFAGADIASAHPVGGGDGNPPTFDPSLKTFEILQTPTGQQVKRAAVGAEGNVLDHMNASAVQRQFNTVGQALIGAFDGHPPKAIFTDSLEVYGASWTGDLFAEFQRRRGYDLAPHLLSLFAGEGQASGVRHDWALTLSELTEERYLVPFTKWAHEHHTLARAQVYGVPPVRLSSNQFVDLAEGEGANWRGFSTMRWASSANHAYGNAITSAESWTWLHAGAFRATPLDIKAEADTLMLSGVNQFIAHGWPYSPPNVHEPGLAFYAAAVFNDHNPWWGVMPDVNRYLQRMSYLMRQGRPVADVAVFLPQDDAMAEMTPSDASVVNQLKRTITEAMTAQILDAGYSFDYVDSRIVLAGAITAKVLVLPRVRRIDPAVLDKIKAFAAYGGRVLAIDQPPDHSAGFLHADSDSAAVQATSASLFAGRVVAEDKLGAALKSLSSPDLEGGAAGTGFVHRRLANGDVYFVANTTNQAVTAPLRFRDSHPAAQWWDPITGKRIPGLVRR